MTRLLALLMMFTVACGVELADEPLVPDPESVETIDVPEVGSIQQASQTHPAPRTVLLFPENQGAWLGQGNGQYAHAPFDLYWSEIGYGYDDDRINISRNIFTPSSQCVRLSQGSMRCSGTTYTCPSQSCTNGNPVAYRPDGIAGDYWGWSTGADSPGRNGWRAGTRAGGVQPRQCNDEPPSISVSFSSFGGILDCSYPMPAYWIIQF